MDLALTVAEVLRREGVVGSLVEVTGDGAATLTATQRACVSNMTPEYGATTTLFPVDDAALDYLRVTGRDESLVALSRAYCELQGVFGADEGRRYARTIEIDLASVEPSLAGPSRPHNRVTPRAFATASASARRPRRPRPRARASRETIGEAPRPRHGTIAIAPSRAAPPRPTPR